MRQILLIFIASLFFAGCTSKPLQDRSDIVIKHRAAPIYPIQAAKDNIEGSVAMTFDVDENGKPVNIKVVEATQKKLFDKAAIKCLSKWRYHPKVVNGEAVKRNDLKLRLDFRLAKT